MQAADARPPVRQWRIHLGAHKTATTHLQETLAAVRDDLVGQGVDFIPNPLVRQRNLARTLSQRRPIARLPIVGRAHMRDAIESVVAPLRAGPEVVVLSEENIIGVPEHMLKAPSYPQAEPNVGRLASLAGRAEVMFFLSIRSYDTLLPSAYVETLKHALPPPGGFQEAVARAACQAAELVRPRVADPRRGARHPLADLAAGGLSRQCPGDHGGGLRLCARAPAGNLRSHLDPLALGGGDRDGRGAAAGSPARRAAGAGPRDLRRRRARRRPLPAVRHGGAPAAARPATRRTSSASRASIPTC